MKNGQITIKDLFDENIRFSIPGYQRYYSWEEEHVKALIDDFKNQKDDKDHYFGTFLLHRNKNVENDFEIVDGQQRLTTLVLLIDRLVNQMKKEGFQTKEIYARFVYNGNLPRITLLPEDDEFFRTKILGKSEINKSDLENPSQKRLAFARSYLERRFAGFSLDMQKAFVGKIERARVLVYTVDDEAEAALIFETVNNRGKKLSNLDKTKSFLMHKAYLTSAKPEVVLKDIQNRFGQIYKDADRADLDEDVILSNHFKAYVPWESREEHRTIDLCMFSLIEKVNQLVNKKGQEEKALNYISKYSNELKQTFLNFRKLFTEDYHLITCLDVLDRTAKFWPLIVKTYSCDSNKEKPKFLLIVKLLEIYDFRVCGVMRKPRNHAESTFDRLSRDFEGDYDWLITELKDLIATTAKDKDFKAGLMAPDLYGKLQNNDLIYFFWSYENFLRQESKQLEPGLSNELLTNDDTKTTLTIEHIAPQTPSEKLTVLSSRSSIPQEYTDAFEETYLHSLGNLTIDPASANSSKKNKPFEIKENQYFRESTFKVHQELIEFFNTNTNQWDEESITERREKLITFALKNWSIKSV